MGDPISSFIPSSSSPPSSPSFQFHSFYSHTSLPLFLTRKEVAQQAIHEALELSQQYGATSPQARVAWEIAEEVENSVYSPCSKRCDPFGSYNVDDYEKENPLL